MSSSSSNEQDNLQASKIFTKNMLQDSLAFSSSQLLVNEPIMSQDETVEPTLTFDRSPPPSFESIAETSTSQPHSLGLKGIARSKKGEKFGDKKTKTVRFEETTTQYMPQYPTMPSTPSRPQSSHFSVPGSSLNSGRNSTSQPRLTSSEVWWESTGLSLDEAVAFDRQFLYSQWGQASGYSDPYNSEPVPNWFTTLWARMVWLTLVFLGLQFTWALETSYGTPYLLSLGLSKTSLSLVWLAGPLSGLVMQPLVGVLSDKCQSKLGRRRPFLIVGGFGVLFSLISIGWTAELVEYLGGPPETTKLIAITAFFLLDFSINTIQAAARALVVDVLPGKLQDVGNAWAGRMLGVGNVIGYFMGYLDLVSAFPFLGNKQLKVLCFFACVLITFTIGVTCGMVQEIPLLNVEPYTNPENAGMDMVWVALVEIGSAVRQLPAPIRDILKVQFFAWVGWFPFLFYSTDWVAEFLPPSQSHDSVGETTREGSRGFFIYALVSLAASFFLPYLSRTPQGPLWKPTIYQLFTASLLMFGMIMLSTVFVQSSSGATFLIILNGVPWAVAMWAPFALIGDYIHRQKGHSGVPADYLPLQNIAQSGHASSWEDPSSQPSGEPVLAAGIVLGIHNIAIVAPQLLLSLSASLVFRLIGTNASSGWIFPVGGISALLATYYSTKLWR